MDIQKRLVELLDNAAGKYSHFSVASIIITKDGDVYEGVNYESASYGGTLCAERNAIGSAITAGMKRGELSEVHIIARDPRGVLVPASACGICRQVIAEQSKNEATVFTYDENGVVDQDKISSLLPKAFLGELL